jgi:hypothetical protein
VSTWFEISELQISIPTVLEFEVQECDPRVQIAMNLRNVQSAHLCLRLLYEFMFLAYLIPPTPLWTKNSARRNSPDNASAIPCSRKVPDPGHPVINAVAYTTVGKHALHDLQDRIYWHEYVAGSVDQSAIAQFATWGRERLPDGRPRTPVIVLTGTELFCGWLVEEAWKELGGQRAAFVTPPAVRLENLWTLADLTQQIYLGLPNPHTSFHRPCHPVQQLQLPIDSAHRVEMLEYALNSNLP